MIGGFQVLNTSQICFQKRISVGNIKVYFLKKKKKKKHRKM